eukprot:2332333-Rhodomonas_salina.2
MRIPPWPRPLEATQCCLLRLRWHESGTRTLHLCRSLTPTDLPFLVAPRAGQRPLVPSTHVRPPRRLGSP